MPSDRLSGSELTVVTVAAINGTTAYQMADINDDVLYVSTLAVQQLFASLPNGALQRAVPGRFNTAMQIYDAMNNAFVRSQALS